MGSPGKGSTGSVKYVNLREGISNHSIFEGKNLMMQSGTIVRGGASVANASLDFRRVRLKQSDSEFFLKLYLAKCEIDHLQH